MNRRKVEGCYDYDGACKPGPNGEGVWAGQHDFSVSIFMWVRKAYIGLKKAKAVYRVKGAVSNSEAVYRRAEDICDFLNDGGILKKKSERVSDS